jgi:hypothetical protein
MKVEEMTDQVIDQIFKGLDESKLDGWSQGFVTNIKVWWKQKRKLSDKQKKRLGEIWSHQNAPKPK